MAWQIFRSGQSRLHQPFWHCGGAVDFSYQPSTVAVNMNELPDGVTVQKTLSKKRGLKAR